VLRSAVAIAGGVLAFAGCATADRDERVELERQLLKTEFTQCANPGGCHSYRRTHADCAENGFKKEGGRTFYRCRIESEEVGGSGRVTETVCAALGSSGEQGYDVGYTPQPLAVCRR
jgi:hypothetical protein